ncbi:hypothetical protein [Paraburkholderia sp. RL17-373-BIF-A]|uniref:hypothetical protein n=1 Tax=Paraburkholderia sp. RL17-373-BIF-A TaxID=3031629 RepID=UPI0038BBDC51
MPELVTNMYISYPLRAFLLTGLVLAAMGANLASKAADGVIFTADAMVFPSERYLLTTPSDATVVKAPVFGSAHFPAPDLPADPDARAEITASWSVGDGDANAVAQMNDPAPRGGVS